MTRFSGLERGVLRFINGLYDIPWHPHDTKRIIAVGERPLPSLQDIQSQFCKQSSEAVETAVANLRSFQCIVPVYLFDKTDYAEVAMAPGEYTRMPICKPGTGIQAFQITARGQNEIESFWRERCTNLVMAFGKTITEKTLHWIVAFLLGVLVASLLGLDIKHISIGPVDASPQSAKPNQ